MVKRSMAQGQRILDRMMDTFEDPSGLASTFAAAVLRQAVSNASSKPTPQSRMAADVLGVSRNVIRSAGNGPGVAVGQGAEFGSSLYPQFHKPSNSRGYWLMPATEQVASSRTGDSALEEVMDRVIRTTL